MSRGWKRKQVRCCEVAHWPRRIVKEQVDGRIPTRIREETIFELGTANLVIDIIQAILIEVG